MMLAAAELTVYCDGREPSLPLFYIAQGRNKKCRHLMHIAGVLFVNDLTFSECGGEIPLLDWCEFSMTDSLNIPAFLLCY